MTTLFITYTIFYSLLMLSFCYLFVTTFKSEITFKSFPHMIFYIIKYSKLKLLYYGLVVSLVGIPPFIFFFIKTNIIIFFLSKFYFDLILFIFLIFFLNMIFYIQTFFLKNFKYNEKLVITHKHKSSFPIVFFINYLLFLFYFNVFFFQDLYFFITLLS